MKSETTMAKKSYMYQNKSPMSAKEKQLRDAEAAAVRKFMRKAPKEDAAPTKSLKSVRIKDVMKEQIKAATLLQSIWRGVVTNRATAALKVAETAAKEEAAGAAAAMRRIEGRLPSSLALLMRGERFGVVVRGDMTKKKLSTRFVLPASMV